MSILWGRERGDFFFFQELFFCFVSFFRCFFFINHDFFLVLSTLLLFARTENGRP